MVGSSKYTHQEVVYFKIHAEFHGRDNSWLVPEFQKQFPDCKVKNFSPASAHYLRHLYKSHPIYNQEHLWEGSEGKIGIIVGLRAKGLTDLEISRVIEHYFPDHIWLEGKRPGESQKLRCDTITVIIAEYETYGSGDLTGQNDIISDPSQQPAISALLSDHASGKSLQQIGTSFGLSIDLVACIIARHTETWKRQILRPVPHIMPNSSGLAHSQLLSAPPGAIFSSPAPSASSASSPDLEALAHMRKAAHKIGGWGRMAAIWSMLEETGQLDVSMRQFGMLPPPAPPTQHSSNGHLGLPITPANTLYPSDSARSSASPGYSRDASMDPGPSYTSGKSEQLAMPGLYNFGFEASEQLFGGEPGMLESGGGFEPSTIGGDMPPFQDDFSRFTLQEQPAGSSMGGSSHKRMREEEAIDLTFEDHSEGLQTPAIEHGGQKKRSKAGSVRDESEMALLNSAPEFLHPAPESTDYFTNLATPAISQPTSLTIRNASTAPLPDEIAAGSPPHFSFPMPGATDRWNNFGVPGIAKSTTTDGQPTSISPLLLVKSPPTGVDTQQVTLPSRDNSPDLSVSGDPLFDESLASSGLATPDPEAQFSTDNRESLPPTIEWPEADGFDQAWADAFNSYIDTSLEEDVVITHVIQTPQKVKKPGDWDTGIRTPLTLKCQAKVIQPYDRLKVVEQQLVDEPLEVLEDDSGSEYAPEIDAESTVSEEE